MRELLRLIVCEFRKLKRKKLFYFAFLTTSILPIFYSLLLKDRNLDNVMSVIWEENGFLLLIPLSVIVAASLFFEEHDYDTLKNLMCVPVSKGKLAAAKMSVLLLFDVGYQLAGYVLGIVMALISGAAMDEWAKDLCITLGTGILLWGAAMPCLLLVVWFNKSYIISVIIAFVYAMLGYLMHTNDAFVMVPLGPNVTTFLPVPVIFRWLYQFHSTEGAGEIFLAFYNRFKPYFVSTPAVFAILMSEAALCMALLMHIYRKQDV